MDSRGQAEGTPEDEAFDITSVEKVVDRIDFTYNASGSLITAEYYLGGVLKLTLTYTYDASDNLTRIDRT